MRTRKTLLPSSRVSTPTILFEDAFGASLIEIDTPLPV